MFDLQEAQRLARRQRDLDALVVLRERRAPPALEIERARGELVGDGVGHLLVVIAILGDERRPLVAQLRHLEVIVRDRRARRPRLLGFGEVHQLREDRHLLRPHVAAQQLRVGAPD